LNVIVSASERYSKKTLRTQDAQTHVKISFVGFELRSQMRQAVASFIDRVNIVERLFFEVATATGAVANPSRCLENGGAKFGRMLLYFISLWVAHFQIYKNLHRMTLLGAITRPFAFFAR